jgi:hypothetical protein
MSMVGRDGGIVLIAIIMVIMITKEHRLVKAYVCLTHLRVHIYKCRYVYASIYMYFIHGTQKINLRRQVKAVQQEGRYSCQKREGMRPVPPGPPRGKERKR